MGVNDLRRSACAKQVRVSEGGLGRICLCCLWGSGAWGFDLGYVEEQVSVGVDDLRRSIWR